MSTLTNLIRDTLNNFHLSSDWFGESVTYTPAGGVARSIDVFIEAEEQLQITDIDTEMSEETIKVKCSKDATTGINRPNIGDTIVRDVTADEDTRPFLFEGDYDQESRDHWQLMFRRKRLKGIGVRS